MAERFDSYILCIMYIFVSSFLFIVTMFYCLEAGPLRPVFFFHKKYFPKSFVVCFLCCRFVISMMKHIDLFAGIGGFSLAARWMGWNTVAWVEWEPFCQKVLRHHFPEAEGHGDIDKTDFTKYANTIDILTGGDPCQVSSKIGKREGGGVLYKWPQFFRAVCEAQPIWMVNENVDGTISNGILDRKIVDLESIGYACWPPVVIPASFAGAHHRRDRVILVANAPKRRLQGGICGATKGQWETKIRPASALVQNKNGIAIPQPEFLSGNDGISGWVDQIKSYGNAVVPQVIFRIYQAIELYEKQYT